MRKHKCNKIRRAIKKAYTGQSLSRREKKLLFGRRLSTTQLRKKYRALNITKRPKTLSEDYEFTGADELFCPKCGCTEMKGTGNMTFYPEHWEDFHCLRCGFQVGTIDNSPFCHVLDEMKSEETISRTSITQWCAEHHVDIVVL